MKRYAIPLIAISMLLISGFLSYSRLSVSTQRNDDIREAVFRYQIQLYKKEWPDAKVFFLSLDQNHDRDPGNAFMRRFKGMKFPIKKVSQADSDDGVRDKESGQVGLILQVDEIKRTSASVVEVTGGYFANGLAASGNTYTLEFKHGRWTVVKDKLNWIS